MSWVIYTGNRCGIHLECPMQLKQIIPFLKAGVVIALLPGLIWLGSCKKGNNGMVRAQINYTGQDTIPGPPGLLDTTRHTQFGDFVASITPDSFSGKFRNIRFQDEWDNNARPFIMELIDNNADLNDPQRYADFSSGSQVELFPRIFWANPSNKAVDGKTFRLTYFYWNIHWFHQVFSLPSAYDGVPLMQFGREFNYTSEQGGWARRGLRIRSDHYPLMDPMFGNPPGELPQLFVFGNTDSSFVFNMEYLPAGNSKDNPEGGTSNQPIIRSHQYQPLDFNYSEIRDLNVRAVVSFDFADLIHIYAGRDNKPYTYDDVFVYAPRFWERLKVRVVQVE